MAFECQQIQTIDSISKIQFECLITDLPPALISKILNSLEPKELGIVCCVSTTLCRVASEHQVWKQFYCDRWGLPIGVVDNDIDKSWKQLFVEREFRSKMFLGRYVVDALYGHTEAVLAVSILVSAKLVFTCGYDSIVRMWDLEEGLLVASSLPLGCTVRAIAADTKLLVAGGTDGFIHCWRMSESVPYLFDVSGSKKENNEFRLWEHQGAITCLALDLTRIFSGSWDMTVRVWDRALMKCLKVLRHSDWVYALAPHDTTIACTSGSDVYLWDISSGSLLTVIYGAHVGNVCSLARSRAGDFVFTGGEDGVIHMFEIVNDCEEGDVVQVATWKPHSASVNSLAFEFPWLVSASGDGKLALIDIRKLLRTSRSSYEKRSLMIDVEPPQRMLHGFECNLLSVAIGADRILCGGEKGVIRMWNFSQALEIEKRARALRGIRLENRLRRRRLQNERNGNSGRASRCSVAAKKNENQSGVWQNRHEVSRKLKA